MKEAGAHKGGSLSNGPFENARSATNTVPTANEGGYFMGKEDIYLFEANAVNEVDQERSLFHKLRPTKLAPFHRSAKKFWG
jgi:hypothetical protein